MKNNISNDFIHLSQALTGSDEFVLYELVSILKNCLDDPAYKEIAEQNLIAFIMIDKKIENGLKNIVDSKDNDLTPFKSIANQILKQVESQVSCLKR